MNFEKKKVENRYYFKMINKYLSNFSLQLQFFIFT